MSRHWNAYPFYRTLEEQIITNMSRNIYDAKFSNIQIHRDPFLGSGYILQHHVSSPLGLYRACPRELAPCMTFTNDAEKPDSPLQRELGPWSFMWLLISSSQLAHLTKHWLKPFCKNPIWWSVYLNNGQADRHLCNMCFHFSNCWFNKKFLYCWNPTHYYWNGSEVESTHAVFMAIWF